MNELKPRIHENGRDYVLVGDYYVPDLKLPEERRPIAVSYTHLVSTGPISQKRSCGRLPLPRKL